MTVFIALAVLAALAAVPAIIFLVLGRKRFSDSRKGSTAAMASVWDTVTGGEMASLTDRLLAKTEAAPARQEPSSMTLEELSASKDPFPDPLCADWEDPSFLMAESARAMSMEKSGESEAAVACLENCSNSFPGRSEPILRAALVCARSGDHDRLQEFRRRLGMLPSVPIAATILMERLSAMSRRDSGLSR